MTEHLKQLGYNVYAVESCSEGLEVLEQGCYPRCIFINTLMRNSKATIKAIKSNGHASTPLIALSYQSEVKIDGYTINTLQRPILISKLIKFIKEQEEVYYG